MHVWKVKDNDFLIERDGNLFARAAELLTGKVFPLEMVEIEKPSGFPLYDVGNFRCLGIGWFSSEGERRFAGALFHFLTGHDYSENQEPYRTEPLMMSTRDFLEEHPEVYEEIGAYAEKIMRTREYDEWEMEFECFLAEYPKTIPARDRPRWRDIFHLLWKRTADRLDYEGKEIWPVEEEKLQEFISLWKEGKAPLSGGTPVREKGKGNISFRILIDGDACPVIRETERIAASYGISCFIYCDDSREMESSYSRIIRVPRGANSADWAIVGDARPGDIVITQDFGLASMVLAKRAHAMHQDGWRYELSALDKGVKKRKKRHPYGKRRGEEDGNFEEALDELVSELMNPE